MATTTICQQISEGFGISSQFPLENSKETLLTDVIGRRNQGNYFFEQIRKRHCTNDQVIEVLRHVQEHGDEDLLEQVGQDGQRLQGVRWFLDQLVPIHVTFVRKMILRKNANYENFMHLMCAKETDSKSCLRVFEWVNRRLRWISRD